jgi:hypothetical protein
MNLTRNVVEVASYVLDLIIAGRTLEQTAALGRDNPIVDQAVKLACSKMDHPLSVVHYCRYELLKCNQGGDTWAAALESLEAVSDEISERTFQAEASRKKREERELINGMAASLSGVAQALADGFPGHEQDHADIKAHIAGLLESLGRIGAALEKPDES